MSRLKFLVVVVGTAIAASMAACGSDVVGAGDTPGFSDEQRALDESPFELARPEGGGGPTTIATPPTLFVPGRAPEPVETTTTTPTTSTTFPIPQAPSLATVPVSFCGFTSYLYSLVSIFTNEELDIESSTADAPRIIAAFRQFTPPEIQADVALVADTVLSLVAELEAADYDVSEPAFRKKIAGMVSNQPEYEPFLSAYQRVTFVEVSGCG